MANYTLKDLKEMTTEELIGKLVIGSSSTTKSTIQQEDKIFKVLAERNVIDYDAMKREFRRIHLW